MTKKSSARLQRDAEQKKHAEHLQKNTAWSDLVPVYQECLMLLAQHTLLGALGQDKELLSFLGEDTQAVIDNVKSLRSDLTDLSAELKAIHNLHAEKSGGAHTDADLIETFQIFEQYQLFMTRHDGTVLETSKYLAELFDKAEKRRAAATMAQDPTTTTPIDVVARDVPPAAATPDATTA